MLVLRSVLALCLIAGCLTAADDPFSGTWKLNAAKSKYTPGPTPDNATVTITSDGTSSTVRVQSSFEGKPVTFGYTAKLDGTPATVTGSLTTDSVSVRKSGERAREIRSMKGGKPVGQSKATLSTDGKVLTLTGTGVNPKGQNITFTAVYDRQ